MPDTYNDDAPEQQTVQDDAQQQQVETLPEKYEEFFSDVTSEEKAPSQPTEKEEPSSDDWEHKYRVLKGKYDKEVPRLTRELRALQQDRENLLNRISLLEGIVSEKLQNMQTPKAPEEEDEELARVKEEYPEIYKAVTKLVEKKISREVRPEIEQVKTSSTQNIFYSKLDALVPEWRSINSDPNFLDWLSTPSEEIPTKTKHQLMLLAFQEGDANAVASFFKRYLNQISSEEETPMKAPAEKSVAPPHRKTVQQGKETSKKMFTESEIRNFYTNVALGKIPADRKDALEQQILKAIMENRVIYGK